MFVEASNDRLRDQDGGTSANGRQQRRFDDRRSRQPPPACTERAADSHLARARDGAGEQEIGDVDAGNQQHQDDQPRDHQQRRPNRLDDLGLKWVQGEGAAAVGVGKACREPPADGRRHGVRLIDGDVWLQAGNAAERAKGA